MEQLEVHGPVFLIESDKIKPNPQQPRRAFDEAGLRELANSIREFGILQPLVVSKVEQEIEAGTAVEYQLIAGERRLLAAKIAGLERVPAIIRNVALDRERLELAIVENIQRVDLNPIEAARAYSKLQDHFGLTQREIAVRVGKSRETVANTMRLLSLPNQIQEALAAGRLSESQARLLLSVADLAIQQSLFDDLIKNNVSVRELRSRIRETKASNQKGAAHISEAAPPVADSEAVAVQQKLEEFLGTRVQVERSGSSGKITISFFSPEELNGIVWKLLDHDEQELLNNAIQDNSEQSRENLTEQSRVSQQSNINHTTSNNSEQSRENLTEQTLVPQQPNTKSIQTPQSPQDSTPPVTV